VGAGIEKDRHDDDDQVEARHRHAVRHHPCVNDGGDRQEDKPEQRDDQTVVRTKEDIREEPHQDQDDPREGHDNEREQAGHGVQTDLSEVWPLTPPGVAGTPNPQTKF
jgi:hypothetical protein